VSRARLPVVALIGRQNVGKSTLANRLVGRRQQVAHESAGVTRDRVELETSWRGRRFVVVDTGGYRPRGRGVEALVTQQADRAAESADLILLVVDARTGPLDEDEAIARRLRRVAAPIQVVANMVDTEQAEPDAAAFNRLGLGEPLPVSALHGRGAGELLDRIIQLLPDRGPVPPESGEPRFALVGRPNVGKSSLFNRLVGEERSVVFEEAGTTRDAVDAVVDWPTGPVRFVDTAGFRRPSRARGIEYYSFLRASKAIERADVAVLVLDAADGFTAEDRRIAARVMEMGRGLYVVANKWDLVEEREAILHDLTERARPFGDPKVARASALTGAGVGRIPADLVTLHERWSMRASTAEVNRCLEEVQRTHPMGVRYRYGTQVRSGPPTIIMFGGRAPGAAEERFLERRFRERFSLWGVPIRLRFREGSARARR